MKKKKTFAVIGLGRFGRSVAVKLYKMGYEVLAVDTDEEIVNNIAPFVTQAVTADAKEESVLKNLGIRNCDCAVVGITENLSDSILITLLLKELGIKQVVCKAVDRNHKKILEKIGADNVIIPEYEVGIKTAMNLVSNNFLDFLKLSSKYGIIDMSVPDAWVGKTIIEIDVRRKHGINIIAIKNRDDENDIIMNPSPERRFTDADVVVVAGDTQAIRAISG